MFGNDGPPAPDLMTPLAAHPATAGHHQTFASWTPIPCDAAIRWLVHPVCGPWACTVVLEQFVLSPVGTMHFGVSLN